MDRHYISCIYIIYANNSDSDVCSYIHTSVFCVVTHITDCFTYSTYWEWELIVIQSVYVLFLVLSDGLLHSLD
jgi:hypothetical protein